MCIDPAGRPAAVPIQKSRRTPRLPRLATVGLILAFAAGCVAPLQARSIEVASTDDTAREKGRLDPVGEIPPTVASTAPSLEALAREVVRRNPHLTALRQAAAAARHRVPQAGALDDPMAGIVFSNLPVESFALDETPMTGVELRWSQRLPWPGKRALRSEAAALDAEIAEERIAEAALMLVARTKTVWYELVFLERALAISRRNQDLLQDLLDISEEKYAVGRGVQADVTRAQVALSRIMDRILTLEARREAAQARINALRDRPDETPVDVPSTIPSERIELRLGALVARAEGNRPLLAELRRAIERAETRKALARKSLKPDFTVAGGYRIRDRMPMDPVDGEDFVSASVMINVPLWAGRKQKMRIAEEGARARRAEAMLEEARLAIRGRIAERLATLRGLEREILLYETGILAQAEQSLASSRSGYEVDRVDFLSYLDSWKTLLEEEINHARAVTSYRKELALLESEVGTELGSLAAAPAEGKDQTP